MRSGPTRILVATIVAGLACGESPADDPPMKTPPGDDTDGGTAGSGDLDPAPPGEATDLCRDAPSVDAGRHYGTLRGNLSVLSGACGGGGPDAFVLLDVPIRADVELSAVGVGFSPKVGVLGAGCSDDWSRATLACTQGIGTWLLDVAAGSQLLVSVGIDPDDPMLQLPAPAEGDDPLNFALDIALRTVLEAGEQCEPASRGRCGIGTACVAPDSDKPGMTDPPVCTAIEGDTCALAPRLPVGFGTTLVQISPAVPHTDAHAHTCTGAHRPERVVALDLPASEVARRLVVTSKSEAIGLAIRAASCVSEAERDCAAPSAGGVQVQAEIAATDDDRVFVFVELPPAAVPGDSGGETGGDDGSDGGAGTDGGDPGMGEEAPIAIEVTVSEAASGD